MFIERKSFLQGGITTITTRSSLAAFLITTRKAIVIVVVLAIEAALEIAIDIVVLASEVEEIVTIALASSIYSKSRALRVLKSKRTYVDA